MSEYKTGDNFRIEEIRIDRMMMISIAVFFISVALFILLTYLGLKIHVTYNILIRPEYEIIGLVILPLLNIILHELIHALTYLIVSKGAIKDFEFGFVFKKMIAYCYLKKDISIRDYRLIALMPLLILLPAAVVIYMIIPGPASSLFLVISLTGPVFDIYYIFKLRRFSSGCKIRETREQDHLFVLVPE
ncbi:MAG TPA: DUF3267 domain-containing protein [Firmicutes bacterium]|nr:DUF3267 domain-containing protein [Bacillota bacterium]